MRSVEVGERRARLARRQGLSPFHRAADVVDAADRMVCLHATDPATVFLSAWARVDGMRREDLEKALYADRSLVKHLAMRRTLFVFPRETLPVAQAGASNRVAGFERRRVIADVEKAGLFADGASWLEAASDAVMAALRSGRDASSTELRKEIPLLEGSYVYGVGKSWEGRIQIGPRVLTVLSASGRIVRATNSGSWTASRPRWTSMTSWLGEELAPMPDADGVRAMVELWLRAFGPGTEADVKWWLGSTLGAVRRAIAELGAVEVDLDGRTGYLLPDDLEPEPPVEPWAALLPSLDPTTMGWHQREWYLGPYKQQLFDTAGNAGPTVWWDGRIVGGWRQDAEGGIVLQLLEDIGTEGRRAVVAEADRLNDWIGGTRLLPRFPSPLWKDAG